MNNKEKKNFGSWPSALSAETLAKAGNRYGHLTVDEGKVYWLESLPEEGGRTVIYQGGCGTTAKVITPNGYSVRTRVHEYGGADFSVQKEKIIFSNDLDQRLYLQTGSNSPVAITPEPEFTHEVRYADIVFSSSADWIICIRERHPKNGDPLLVINEIVKITLPGSSKIDEPEAHNPKVIVSGADFYSYPRISPKENQLAWTSWNHPNMPWDQTALCTAALDRDGNLSNITELLNNKNESIYQPAWCPDGELHFVSDRNNWWNIYSFRDQVLNAITPTDADFGYPQWQFGTSSYAFIDAKTLFAAYSEEGREHLCLVEPEEGHITPLELPYCSYQGGLYYADNHLYFIASSEQSAASVIAWDLSTKMPEVLSNVKAQLFSSDDISIAEAITYPTTNEQKAHAFYYAATHSQFEGLDNEKPPLIVMSHGGPTAAAKAEFNNNIQYWTSRGFAVVDVNYRGSSGFGRNYRDQLKGQWGIVDVEDCVKAVEYLVERGSVDPKKLAIRGGSAGGYTTYTALTNYSIFSAGVSRYGVADLTCLVKESHKFEVRYLDSIIGPWPASEALYQSRSPINHADKIDCPVLLLQGDEDAVVPPAQSISMAESLDKNNIPHALIMLKGEQHGFRRSENIAFALQSELNFYCQIFNIEPDEQLAELKLKNR